MKTYRVEVYDYMAITTEHGTFPTKDRYHQYGLSGLSLAQAQAEYAKVEQWSDGQARVEIVEETE